MDAEKALDKNPTSFIVNKRYYRLRRSNKTVFANGMIVYVKNPRVNENTFQSQASKALLEYPFISNFKHLRLTKTER